MAAASVGRLACGSLSSRYQRSSACTAWVMSQVVQARCPARRVAEAVGPAEPLEAVGQTVPGIGLAAALAIGQQGCLHVVRELAPRGQVLLHFPGSLVGEGDEAGLVKLRFLDA